MTPKQPGITRFFDIDIKEIVPFKIHVSAGLITQDSPIQLKN
jgi:hypothetical protein